jgi:hypothetical protein
MGSIISRNNIALPSYIANGIGRVVFYYQLDVPLFCFRFRIAGYSEKPDTQDRWYYLDWHIFHVIASCNIKI